MSEHAVCAHVRVSWHTKQIEGGLTTGWWECDSGCGMRFTTVPHAVDLHFQAAPPPDVTTLVAKWREKAEGPIPTDRAIGITACANELEAWAMAQRGEG